MSEFTIIPPIVLGYALVACLMMALWANIPPKQTVSDIMMGVVWPLVLLLILPAAFINACVRAIEDKNGQFAGLDKSEKWRKQYKEGR